MRRDEYLAGAPIMRGRWAAMGFLWWSGYFAGRTNPIGDLILYGGLQPNDFISDGIAVLLLIAGVICLDQYGRNTWFIWAPDDATWAGRFTRDDVKRKSCPGKPRPSAH